MRRAFRRADDLRTFLGLPAGGGPDDFGFPVFVPREFATRMTPGDPHDPLLRQVLTDPREGDAVAGFTADPVGDLAAGAAPGLLHKYAGRSLVVTTGACGVHCRYCFRRHYPYAENRPAATDDAPAVEYLRSQTSVEEVILSGGDPLTLTDPLLDRWIERIESIPHVRRLRIHSRMPIVIPSRVTQTLLARLRQSRLTVWMVVHANHPREIDTDTADALSRLVDGGIPVLNQSVLLRDINDDADVLEDLSTRLIDRRVMPYYLHLLDRVAGAAHFHVDAAVGRQLIEQLRARLPGYAVPQLVVEQAGQSSKTPVD